MDWTEHRKKVLAEARRIVVKVGSAVLTTDQGLDRDVLASLAGQISTLKDRGLEVVLVSSGAVAAGRRVLCSGQGLCRPIKGMPDRQAASAVGQSRLMHAYDQIFADLGRITAQILLTKDDLASRRRFLNARHTFTTLLSWGAVPIVNENDSVVVKELEFGDNDSLASLVLNLVEADLIVNLTSAPGVFTANPEKDPQARRLEVVEDIFALDLASMCGGKTESGTGGMYSKLMAARRSAQLGSPTLILSGREKNGLVRVFDGESLGTWIVPDKKSISSRKHWLAYNNEPKGGVVVDKGAARALSEGKKSLLPAGIREVDGQFGRGALVRILSEEGKTIGVGLCNYKASDLRRIMGKKSNEIESILGQRRTGHYPEAVHRDNMLLDAAL